MDGANEHNNKEKIRLFVEAVWNEGRLELIDELVAADYVGRVPAIDNGVHGPEGVRRLVAWARHAHPDLYVKIEDQVAEEDRVATRWRAAPIAPVARATEAAPCYAGISIIRLLAGKQVDSHTEYANLNPAATCMPAEDTQTSAPGARPAPSPESGLRQPPGCSPTLPRA